MPCEAPRNGAKRDRHRKIKEKHGGKKEYPAVGAKQEERSGQQKRDHSHTARADEIGKHSARQLARKCAERDINECEFSRKSG